MREDDWIGRMKQKRGQTKPLPVVNFTEDWKRYQEKALELLCAYLHRDNISFSIALLVEHLYVSEYYLMEVYSDRLGNISYARTTWEGLEDYPAFHEVMKSIKQLDKSTLPHTISSKFHLLPATSAGEWLDLLEKIQTVSDEPVPSLGIDGMLYYLYSWFKQDELQYQRTITWYCEPSSPILKLVEDKLHEIDSALGYRNFASNSRRHNPKV